ncbi:HlyD family efflux transporter periplasmic adaptor subunit [bacterium]|nr:HlyD family efflux transporter periplasmic adaptor subunit [bacterium]
MSSSKELLPACRSDLVIRQMNDDEFVVKLPAHRKYFSIGAAEEFLLRQLDGTRSRSQLCRSFEEQFDDSLSDADIDDFLEMIRSRGLLEEPKLDKTDSSSRRNSPSQSEASEPRPAARSETSDESPTAPSRRPELKSESDAADDEAPSRGRQNILFYRLPLFNPDRLFSWLEPRLRFVWTRSFLAISLAGLAAAFVISCVNCDQLASSFSSAMRWDTIVVVWATIIVATMLHEMAHGLTCKHFGGDVPDVGVLFLFFIPCLYCNVTDAWMIREKHKRLLITAAGGYLDLCLWAIAVFVWRVTVPDCLMNHLAFVVQTVCGGRGLINLNPLLRLDGYYLLSDWLSIPNLRKQSKEHWMAHLRWLLWGAERPRPLPRGRTLLLYGMMNWGFALIFLDVIFLQFLKYAGDEFGVGGILFLVLLMGYALRRVFKGFFRSEVSTMLKSRPTRLAAWFAGIATVIGVPFWLSVQSYASGEFEVRPGHRVEVPAAVTGFIQQVLVEEGQPVKAGDTVAVLRSPELESQLSTRRAELQEVDSALAQLLLGARPEEISQQEERVARLRDWVAQGETDLQRARDEHAEVLTALKSKVTQIQVRYDAAQQSIKRSEWLYSQGALAGLQLRAEQAALQVLKSEQTEAQARLRASELSGVHETAAAVELRRQQLADAQAALTLLRAGTRPEVIAAQRARRERIVNELDFLQTQLQRLTVHAPVDGVVVAPRLPEKVGQLAVAGVPICAIEDSSSSQIELSLTEDQARGIAAGQPVTLKARAFPLDTFQGQVTKIAPATAKQIEGKKNVLVVHCTLENSDGRLKSGMTGNGRILRGQRPLSNKLFHSVMSYIRTEFWW